VCTVAHKLIKSDKKQLVFAPSSLILTNNYLPINEGVILIASNDASHIDQDFIMNNKWIFSLVFFLPTLSYASQESHTLGFGIGAGDYEVRDSSIGNYHLFYNFQLSQNWKAEVNYTTVDTTLDLDSFTLSLNRMFSLSKHNDVYLKGGAAFYDYSVNKGDFAGLDEDGIGLTASVGWKYKLDSGFGFYAEYTYTDLGEIDAVVLNTGVSFCF